MTKKIKLNFKGHRITQSLEFLKNALQLFLTGYTSIEVNLEITKNI